MLIYRAWTNTDPYYDTLRHLWHILTYCNTMDYDGLFTSIAGDCWIESNRCISWATPTMGRMTMADREFFWHMFAVWFQRDFCLSQIIPTSWNQQLAVRHTGWAPKSWLNPWLTPCQSRGYSGQISCVPWPTEHPHPCSHDIFVELPDDSSYAHDISIILHEFPLWRSILRRSPQHSRWISRERSCFRIIFPWYSQYPNGGQNSIRAWMVHPCSSPGLQGASRKCQSWGHRNCLWSTRHVADQCIGCSWGGFSHGDPLGKSMEVTILWCVTRGNC